MFLGDRYLGYGACGTPRPDIAQQLAAPTAQYAGFDFNFRGIVTAGSVERPRLFVLSSDGSAAELPLSAVTIAAKLQAELTDSEKIRADLAPSAPISPHSSTPCEIRPAGASPGQCVTFVS